MKMDFDINNLVRVKLTDKGRALHAADHALSCLSEGQKIPYKPRKEDAEGYSEWQLWELMAAFGKHLGNGFDMPFNQFIEFPAPAQPNPSNEQRWAKCVELSHRMSDEHGEFVMVQLPALDRPFASTEQHFVAAIDAQIAGESGQ